MNHDKTVAKLTDFGFTRSCIEHGTGQNMLSDTFCGSASYLAPEVLKGELYNPLVSDCYSMGVVLYVLLHNRKPYAEADRKKLLERQMALDIKFTFLKVKLSDDVKDLIKCHLIPDPTKRYTMEQVFAHKWFGAIQDQSKLPTVETESTKQTKLATAHEVQKAPEPGNAGQAEELKEVPKKDEEA